MNRALGLVIVCCLIAGSVSAEKVQNFSEYGNGTALQFGSVGGLWNQIWGQQEWDWFTDNSKPNVGFLNQDVAGVLTTKTTGLPVLDADMILRFPFAGTILLIANNKGSGGNAGEIVGTMNGVFVADLNANHAIVTDETITVSFGFPIDGIPDAEIIVTETSGKFKSIHAVGPWQWYVNGEITCRRIPSMPVQLNILAALQNNSLILSAEEQIVLSGAYYRNSPQK